MIVVFQTDALIVLNSIVLIQIILRAMEVYALSVISVIITGWQKMILAKGVKLKITTF